LTLWSGMPCEKRFVDIPCTGRNNMVAIGSTVKERALTLRVRFGTYLRVRGVAPKRWVSPTNYTKGSAG
jgi:hypothetical protein